MNIRSTKNFFEENGVVALKADKDKMPGVNELLKELGNTATAIPYYAIFSPGWDKPVHFGGTVLTSGKVRQIVEEALEAAGSSDTNQQAADPIPQTKLAWKPFSQQSLDEQVAGGNVVFVDFTADW